jgi:hypothetical protein
LVGDRKNIPEAIISEHVPSTNLKEGEIIRFSIKLSYEGTFSGTFSFYPQKIEATDLPSPGLGQGALDAPPPISASFLA